VEGQTDTAKLTVAVFNFAKATTNVPARQQELFKRKYQQFSSGN
jgi:hypothetical protein